MRATPHATCSANVRSGIAGFLISSCAAVPSMAAIDLPKLGMENADTHALVMERMLASPQGRFVLVREGNSLCALRFFNARRSHDRKSATPFSTGAESMSVEYEWHFLGDFAGGFLRPGHRQGKGVASRGSTHGIGRLIIPSTSALIKCGSIERMGWHYPYFLGVDDDKTYSLGRQYAPTAWRTIDAVRLEDPRLTWFSTQFGREVVRIPIADLPGSQ